MTISIANFLERVSKPNSELYLMICGEAIVYDSSSRIVYIPISTHSNTSLNPMGDFRTYMGHFLLWSQHVEIQGSSQELIDALHNKGYKVTLYKLENQFQIYSMNNPENSILSPKEIENLSA